MAGDNVPATVFAVAMNLTIIGSGDAFGSGGRYNTCLKLDAGGASVLIDLGASSMLGLQRAGVDCNSISTIIFTHYHGDHFAGLPFFILDAMFVSRRTEPLVLAGGGDIKARVRAMLDVTYPGFAEREKAFDIRYVDIDVGGTFDLSGVAVKAFPMVHDELAGPCLGYRFHHNGRTLAFTGDTGWTDALLPLADGADVLVSECCYRSFDLTNHLNLRQLIEKRSLLASKRMILTHMSEEMLDYAGALPDAEKAFDGMRVEI